MSTKKEQLEKLQQFQPGDIVQLSDDIRHDAFRGMQGCVTKTIKSRGMVVVICDNGQRYEAFPENVTMVMPASAAYENCKLSWCPNNDRSAYTSTFGTYYATVYQRFGDKRWVLSSNPLQIQQQLLPGDRFPALQAAEAELKSALVKNRDLAGNALSCFGVRTGFCVDTRIGTLKASIIPNKKLPGIFIDLEPFDGSPSCNLLCLQQEDNFKLRATVYAEIGSNPCDGSKCGDYSHSIGFTKPGESPDADVNPRWAVCGNKTALFEASAEYDYRMAREMIISRMVSNGYEDPAQRYPDALENAVSEYLKNRGYGCDEDYALSEAMRCLSPQDNEERR